MTYINSLINADLFYTNINNTTFQQIPIPHLTRTIYETEIPSLTRIFFLSYLIPLNLLNAIFGQHNFVHKPKVALTKELVYLGNTSASEPQAKQFLL